MQGTKRGRSRGIEELEEELEGGRNRGKGTREITNEAGEVKKENGKKYERGSEKKKRGKKEENIRRNNRKSKKSYRIKYILTRCLFSMAIIYTR